MNEDKEPLKRQSFPSNSKNPIDNSSEQKDISTPKVKKIIKGQAKKQKRSFGKRMADVFLEDDTKSVSSYMVKDVLIPAGKALICDIVGWGGFAELLLFGGASRSRSRPGNRHDGRTSINYGSFSRNAPEKEMGRTRAISRTARSRHDFDEIILDTRGEAEEVLNHLADLITDYGMASVADLYDLVGIDNSFTDHKYGWFEANFHAPSRIRNGYILNLPKPQPLD